MTRSECTVVRRRFTEAPPARPYVTTHGAEAGGGLIDLDDKSKGL